jgi:DNA polymerase I-like protein with 3'-5' exonuclease and polymerase domains
MKIAAIDIETSGLDPNTDCIHSIAIVTNDDKKEVIDVSFHPESWIRFVIQQIADEYDVVVMHNAKFDASFLYTKYGVEFKNLHCSYLASQMLQNSPKLYHKRHGLAETIKTFLKIDVIDNNHKQIMRQKYMEHTEGTPIDQEMSDYVLEDTLHLIPLYEAQMKFVNRYKMHKVMALENRLIPVLVKMETQGCLINRDSWQEQIGDWEDKYQEAQLKLDAILKELVDTLPQLAGAKFGRERVDIRVFQQDMFGEAEEIKHKSLTDINFGSQDQIKKLLLRVDNIEAESVDEDHIKLLVTEHPKAHLNEFLTILLEYREYAKLVSTYGESFLDRLDDDNYVHTNFSQCRARTGRMSSSAPNLQNIPSRGDGAILRSFFVPREGHSFITCDHNGAEVSLAADFSQEPLLTGALLDGVDMHSELANVSFRIIFDDPEFVVSNSEETFDYKGHKITPNVLRTVHKSVTFAKFYKAGKATIYKTLSKYINMFHPPNKRMEVAGACSKALDKRMPVLTVFLDKKIKEAQRNGFLRGKFGRMRWMKEDVYGEAANYPIQNANAEAMKIALINIDKYLEEIGVGRIVLTVHDEVVVEVPDAQAEEASTQIEKLMGESLSYFMDHLIGGATSKVDKKWVK